MTKSFKVLVSYVNDLDIESYQNGVYQGCIHEQVELRNSAKQDLIKVLKELCLENEKLKNQLEAKQ